MQNALRSIKNDWSISATVAGFLAVLISYSGPLIIFFQAAQNAHVSNEMMVSWIWGISIGAAVAGIYLSVKYKVPVITAWSAPGTALLVTLFPHISLNEVVAAYIIAAVVIFIIGITGYFDVLLKWIPQDIAAAMMAGILFQFGLGLFKATDTMPVIVFGMLLVFLLAKRFSPRYAMVWVLVAGVALSLAGGKMNPVEVNFSLAMPQFIAPEWTWNSVFNLAIPLILVSLSGQFLPGMAIMKLSGYDMPAKPIIGVTSVFVGDFCWRHHHSVGLDYRGLVHGQRRPRRSRQALHRRHRQRGFLHHWWFVCRQHCDVVQPVAKRIGGGFGRFGFIGGDCHQCDDGDGQS